MDPSVLVFRRSFELSCHYIHVIIIIASTILYMAPLGSRGGTTSTSGLAGLVMRDS